MKHKLNILVLGRRNNLQEIFTYAEGNDWSLCLTDSFKKLGAEV